VRGIRFDHPSIVGLAKKCRKGPVHIFLRYSLQKDFVPLVKSVDHARIVANLDVFEFELDSTEVIELDQCGHPSSIVPSLPNTIDKRLIDRLGPDGLFIAAVKMIQGAWDINWLY